MKNMGTAAESSNKESEADKVAKPLTPVKETKDLVIDEVSEPDKSETDSSHSDLTESKSNASGAANLKIDNSSKPVSGGVTPRSKVKGDALGLTGKNE